MAVIVSCSLFFCIVLFHSNCCPKNRLQFEKQANGLNSKWFRDSKKLNKAQYLVCVPCYVNSFISIYSSFS